MFIRFFIVLDAQVPEHQELYKEKADKKGKTPFLVTVTFYFYAKTFNKTSTERHRRMTEATPKRHRSGKEEKPIRFDICFYENINQNKMNSFEHRLPPRSNLTNSQNQVRCRYFHLSFTID